MFDNDSSLSSGVGSTEVFGNERMPEVNQEELDAEREKLVKLLPSAQLEVDSLNQEIAQVNTLTDFLASLTVPITDHSEESLRTKLDSRIGYLNYLINRKTMIVEGLKTINQDVDDIAPDSQPITSRVASLHALKSKPHHRSLMTQLLAMRMK